VYTQLSRIPDERSPGENPGSHKRYSQLIKRHEENLPILGILVAFHYVHGRGG
jgi:hypothetical protein